MSELNPRQPIIYTVASGGNKIITGWFNITMIPSTGASFNVLFEGGNTISYSAPITFGAGRDVQAAWDTWSSVTIAAIGGSVTIIVNGDVVLPGVSTGGGGGGGDTYTGISPSNVAVGGISAGTNLTGKTFTEFVQLLTVSYLPPTFSSFLMAGQSLLAEIGDSISGNKTFTWATANSGNVQPNSIAITDLISGVALLTGGANDGTELLPIGTVVFTSTSYTYRIQGTNTNSGNFTRNFTIATTYPYFFGKTASGGAPSGSNRPTINQTLINSGTKVLEVSTGTVTVNFNSTADDYIWFAIPSVSASKTAWFVSALNNGAIGGSISPSGNLFPDLQLLSVTTVIWAGVSYKVYLSNYQTASTSNMELRN